MRQVKPVAYGTLLAAALLAAALLSGCTEDKPQGSPGCEPGTLECTCGPEQSCAEGRCAEGACVACPEGTLRCACDAQGACAQGLACLDDLCVEDSDSCPPGEAGCPCDQGGCGEGLTCMDSSCVELPTCPEGSADCPCEQGACQDNLICINDLCRACDSDTAGCPCDEGACGQGLTCEQGACRDAQACADLACAPQQLCQEAADSQDARCLEACQPGFVWEPGSLSCQAEVILPSCAPDAPQSLADTCAQARRQCVDDAEQGASCGDCLEGLLEEEGACRDPRDCQGAGCEALGRTCDPAAPGQDATCGGCRMGFLEQDGQCVADTRSNCLEADPNSILTQCQAQQRQCVPSEQGATCGDCLEDLVEDPQSDTCRPLSDFNDCRGDEDCPAPLSCISLRPNQEPRCLPAPCPQGQSWDQRTQACTGRCGCTGEGLTGEPWPVTDRNGDCVCETLPGYFFNTSTGSRQGEPCDADGDGWTRRSAFAHVNHDDLAIQANARCEIRSIGQLRLVNEYGQALALSIEQLSNGRATSEDLYETNESDDLAEVLERQEAPYGARRFDAAEVNPLTRACATARADLNDNGISDLREHHQSQPDPQRDWMRTFAAASYLVELHTGHYLPPAQGQLHGTYVITERSRCDLSFAAGYDARDGDYWTSCTRRRDGGYDPAEPVNYDFQRWSCANPSGACPTPEPIAAVGVSGEIAPHGLCDGVALEEGTPWRGMNHANQFKCVQIIGDLEEPEHAAQLRRGQLYASTQPQGRHHLNDCSLLACGEGEEGCVASDAPGQGPNPSSPRLRCESSSEAVMADPEALLGRVGLVALRYQDYDLPGEYAGGCLNEGSEWPQLCPGFDPQVPFVTQREGDPNNFGELVCGCGFNFGGPDCDLGCPDQQLHYGGTNLDQEGLCDQGYCVTSAEAQGRSGVWMCGDFALTSYTQAQEGVGAAFHGEASLQVDGETLRGSITVRGHIPPAGFGGAALCQNINENGDCTGITVR